MTGDPTWRVSLHDRWPYMTGDPTWQPSLHDRCPYMTGDPTSQVSLHDGCPYIAGVPTGQVTLHNRWPCIAGSLTWERFDTVPRKCSLLTGCPLVAVPLEDRFYCSNKHHQVTLQPIFIQWNLKWWYNVSICHIITYPPVPMQQVSTRIVPWREVILLRGFHCNLIQPNLLLAPPVNKLPLYINTFW